MDKSAARAAEPRPFEWTIPLRFRTFLGVAGIVLFLVLLVLIRKTLFPFVVAAALAYIMNPATVLLDRYFQRWFSILVVFGVALGLFMLVVVPIFSNIVSELADLPARSQSYRHDMVVLFRQLTETEEVQLTSTDSWYSHHLIRLKSLVKDNPKLEALLTDAADSAKEGVLAAGKAAVQTTTSLFSGLLTMLIVPYLAFYCLWDARKIKLVFKDLVHRDHRDRVAHILLELDRVLGAFLRGQLLISFVVGILLSFGLFILGFDFAFILGPIAGIFNVVPYLGPLVAFVPAVVLAFIKWKFTSAALMKIFWMFCLVAITHLIDSFLMQPLVIGSALEMHPLVMMLALFMGFEFGGLLGMFVSIPAYGMANVLLKNVRVKFS